nr:hypothetical protein [Ralstonia sp. ASV6]
MLLAERLRKAAAVQMVAIGAQAYHYSLSGGSKGRGGRGEIVGGGVERDVGICCTCRAGTLQCQPQRCLLYTSDAADEGRGV